MEHHGSASKASGLAGVVVITGGTAGVGRATARRFAEAGAKIAVLARGGRGLAATAAELARLGARGALGIRCDVADADQVEAAAARIEAELGPIDIWINNAMTTVFGRLQDVTADEFRRVTEVTYLGYVWGTCAALARMRTRNHGTIVQVGSALAHRAIPLQAAFCGAKHAIRGFTDSLRSELLHDRIDIRLTMVQLPAINTPQFDWCVNRMPREPQPVPPIFEPEIAGEAIYRAAHHPRREVLLGAPTVKAVLGQKLAPGLLDRYLAHVAFDGQLTERPAHPERPFNLFAPIEGDHGAKGRFTLRARDRAPVSTLMARLGAAGIQAGAIGLALLAVAGVARLVRRRR